MPTPGVVIFRSPSAVVGVGPAPTAVPTRSPEAAAADPVSRRARIRTPSLLRVLCPTIIIVIITNIAIAIAITIVIITIIVVIVIGTVIIIIIVVVVTTILTAALVIEVRQTIRRGQGITTANSSIIPRPRAHAGSRLAQHHTALLLLLLATVRRALRARGMLHHGELVVARHEPRPLETIRPPRLSVVSSRISSSSSSSSTNSACRYPRGAV